MTFVVAVPPQTQTSQTVTTKGLTITYPQYQSIPQNFGFELNAHVFNSTIALVTNNSVDCLLHFYNPSGEHIYKEWANFSSNGFDFEWEIGSSVFSTLGKHSFTIHCNSTVKDSPTGDAGWAFGVFEVTRSGEVLTTETTLAYYLGAFFLFLLAVIIVYVIQFVPKEDTTNEDGELIQVSQLKYLRPVLWTLAYCCIMMMVFLIGNFADYYISELLLEDSFMLIFTIMFAFLIVALPVYTVYLFYKMYKDGIRKQLIERGVTVHGKSF